MTNASNISRRRSTALKEGNAEYLARRAELVQVAGRLFKINGFKATTLADIGREAGLDRATVYYYVGSKEELFRECLKLGVDANITRCEQIARDKSLTPPEKLQGIITQLMTAYDEHYPHMYVYLQEEMHRITSDSSPWARQIISQTRKFESLVMGLISDLIASGQMREDVAVSVAANAVFGMLNWTHRWYQPGGPHSAAEIAESFCKIFLDGMAPQSKSGSTRKASA